LYPTLHVIKGKYFYFTPLYLLFDVILEINTRKPIKMFWKDQGKYAPQSAIAKRGSLVSCVGTDAEGLVNAKKWIKLAQAGAMGKKQTYYVDYVLYRNKKMKINVTINWNNYYKEVTNRLFFIARKFIKEKLLIHNIQRNEKKNENEQKN
jgi:hypothetical protein